ncbi:MAG: PAS domain-containing sensor histidine kinase [Planctomycetota bacterium]
MNSIARRLVTWLILVAAGVMFGLGVMEYHAGQITIDRELNESMHVISNRLTTSLTESINEFDRQTIHDTVTAEFPASDLAAILVWTQNRQRLLCGIQRTGNRLSDIHTAPTGEQIRTATFVVQLRKGQLHHPIGEIEIHLDRQLPEQRLIQILIRDLGKLAVTIFLLLTILSFLINRYLVAPLEALRHSMEQTESAALAVNNQEALQRVASELPLRLPPTSFSEIEKMHTIFHKMLSTIIARQEELQLKEENLRITFDSIGDGVIATDQEGRVTRMNPVAEALTGWAQAQAQGQPLARIFTLINTQTREPVENPVSQALEKGICMALTSHTTLIAKNGRERQIADSAAPIAHHHGEVVGAVLVFRDITEEYALQKRMTASEEKYRTLYESSSDAILLLDPEEGYLDCNPAALTMFAIPTKEALRQISPVSLSPEYQSDGSRSSELAPTHIEEAFSKGACSFPWTHKDLNGREFPTLVQATRLTIGDKTILQGTIRDVTEQKRIEEMIVQSEKMMSVGGLAAGMAHEINNPLAGMMQTASVIRDRPCNPELNANLRAAEEVGVELGVIQTYMEKRGIFEMIERILSSGSRAADIVRNMLTFARKQSDKKSSHDLADILENCIELLSVDYDLRKKSDFRHIQICREFEAELPPVPCEATKLQQVLMNIMRNGAEALYARWPDPHQSPGPRLTLRLTHGRETKTIRIVIEDNGPGMPEATRKRVFEPFFTTKPTDQGTGLGLSVSYFIITETHGGEMYVESTPGEGTTFTITLPL